MSRDSRNFVYHAYPLTTYYQDDWHKKVQSYLESRYPPLTSRLSSIFRYVDLNPLNKDTFSYELSSLLRDIGSIFGSVMNSILIGIQGTKPRGNYDIFDFKSFLASEITDIEMSYVSLNVSFPRNMVFPFLGFEPNQQSYKWWKAYNNIKHSDIDCLEEGNLSNVIYGISAITVLYDSLRRFNQSYMSTLTSNIISRVWYSERECSDYYYPLANKPEIDTREVTT